MVLCHSSPAAAQAEMLVYPRPSNPLRWDYAIKLVDLALKRAGRVPVLQATEQVMTQSRAARELELGRIDFIWAGTSAEYEQRFRPIPIPVLRGLDGYRICIIHQDRQAAFSAIASIEDLKSLVIGQGPGWSDVTILEAAGLNVVTAPYDSLFGLVERQRIDCFLRGIHEAPGEVIQRKLEHPDIVVESDVMLVYPFSSFFFVNKDNVALAEALETGLKKAYDEGAFMALFTSHPVTRTLLADLRIEKLRRFDIPNPLLTDTIRAIPDRYWHGR
jgi:ABC-type amino acid transport substrate-binding protein